MKILIVAATKAELVSFFDHFKLPDEDFLQTEKFDLLLTGVGMTATAFALGKHLNPSYQLVLNVGIAGSFDRNMALGSLVNITTDVFAELGAENGDHFITINELGFGENTFHASYALEDLPKVNAITVNKVHGNDLSIAKIQQQFTPQVESMEGAAVFYCCEQYSIPCIQVRSISNYVEERHRESWKIGLAINNLNDWAIEFLTHV